MVAVYMTSYEEHLFSNGKTTLGVGGRVNYQSLQTSNIFILSWASL